MIHFLYVSHGFTYYFTYCFSTETIVPENAREFDTLKSKKVPQSLEIGLFFC